MDSKIIEALKKNKEAFGCMSEEMRAVAEGIDKSDFRCIPVDRPYLNWDGMVHCDKPFYAGLTYRLRADYQAKPEIVENEVYLADSGELEYRNANKTGSWLLSTAIDQPDFIGFKYEGGVVWTDSRIYRQGSQWFKHVDIGQLDQYEVLTPTHVLSRQA